MHIFMFQGLHLDHDASKHALAISKQRKKRQLNHKTSEYDLYQSLFFVLHYRESTPYLLESILPNSNSHTYTHIHTYTYSYPRVMLSYICVSSFRNVKVKDAMKLSVPERGARRAEKGQVGR